MKHDHLRNELRGEHPQEVVDVTVDRLLADLDPTLVILRDREFRYQDCARVAWVYWWAMMDMVAVVAMWWWWFA